MKHKICNFRNYSFAMRLGCKIIIFLFGIVFYNSCAHKENLWHIESPDGRLKVEIAMDSLKSPIYSIFLNGKSVVFQSKLGIALNSEDFHFLKGLEFVGQSEQEIHEEYIAISGKRKNCKYQAHEKILTFKNELNNYIKIIFQTSNHGVAFRYQLNNPSELNVVNETSEFILPKKSLAWIQNYKPVWNDYEWYYSKRLVDTMNCSRYYIPGLFQTPEKQWIFISDADVNGDYAACQLTHLGDGKMAIQFPDQKDEWEEGKDIPWFKIVQAESSEIIAPKKLLTPWRLMIISDDLGDIVESNLIENLSSPSRIKDQSWIEPGVAVFPWWGNFTANDDPEILKDYIDLASEMNWKYLEFDIGLLGNNGGYAADHWRSVEYIPEVINYATSKGIKVYGWDERGNLDTPEERDDIFTQYRSWGISGIKMDFINSDKQQAMKWYEEATSHAAEYKLLVSFHGAITPRGLRRTYPNIMTYEGVRGAEYYQMHWHTDLPNPEHNCTLPFTRNVSGPMDYTPTSFSTPRRTSTYAHEVALPFIYESGWICMADKPEEFRSSPAKELFQNLHAAWDDMHFIDGYPGEYCCLARKKGEDWFVAAINSISPRKVDIKFDFLSKEKYSGKVYTDDDKDGMHINNLEIARNSIKSFNLIKNGGFVIHLKQKK